MSRIWPIILLAACLFSGCSKAEFYYSDGQMASAGQEGLIRDMSFRAFCIDRFDADEDGKISDEEIAGITTLDCSGAGISTLSGISVFTSLTTLVCDDNSIREINFRELPRLEVLSCRNNLIEELDLRDTAIQELKCSPMNDAEGNNLLRYIWIRRGQDIEEIDAPDETFIIEMP